MIQQPNGQVRYVEPDGRLTLAGMQLLAAQAREIAAQADRIAALEATVADHEARITALEP